MLSNKAAASGRSSGRSGGGIRIGRLQLRPAIPIVPGGRGKRQRRAAAVPLLPDDALVEILSRVPAKSLCRFKCVSRAWRDLIADRLRCKKLPQTLAGFFVNDGDEIHGGDSDDDGSDRVVGRFINTLGRFVPLASVSFLGNQPGIEEFGFLRSCNGLLLFGHRRAGDTYDSLGYIVCNPATEQWVAVPSSGFKPLPLFDEGEDPGSDSDNEIGCAFTYLIFDPAVSLHFQLVEFISDDCVCVEEVRAYSSETGVWCDSDWSSDCGISFFAGSAIVNGMLHLSVTSFDTHQDLILAVNGEGKDCRSLSGPGKRFDVAFVGESQGLVHCVSQHKDNTRQMTELSIWVLRDYDAEEWVLKHSVDFFKLFGRMNCRVEFDYSVVAIHPDRNLIFFVQHWDLQLKSYDMDSKEVCTLHTLGVGPQNIFPLVPYYAESSALANKH
ncbi:hypothetical protein SETIT_3G396800v2 [Setaria italica]|nr:F-box protein At5g07610 isoform X1 [Setaria italica]RCV19575.1 hypothetical protein SETIT_3G396800v2 [Setaria italica]